MLFAKALGVLLAFLSDPRAVSVAFHHTFSAVLGATPQSGNSGINQLVYTCVCLSLLFVRFP